MTIQLNPAQEHVILQILETGKYGSVALNPAELWQESGRWNVMGHDMFASFALHWCFKDEATEACDSVLTRLQDQIDTAFAPDIHSNLAIETPDRCAERGLWNDSAISRMLGLLTNPVL